MGQGLSGWPLWAFLSAIFAALTAILAKIGVSAIPSDLATFIRTIVILIVSGGIVWGSGQFAEIGTVPSRSWLFLILSGFATGASWLCYFRALKLGPASLVAPIDKLSVVMVAIFGVLFLGERLSGMGWLGVGLIAAGALLIAIKG